MAARKRAAAAERSRIGKSWKWVKLSESEANVLATTSASVDTGTSSRTLPARAVDQVLQEDPDGDAIRPESDVSILDKERTFGSTVS